MSQLPQLFREVISVIIGILIALFINNWNEERKDEAYVHQIFSSIEKELEESSTGIHQIIPKQQASLDTLELYLNSEEISLYGIMVKGNGIHMPTIKTNAWKAIANSRIELIEYEKLSDLAYIEESSENLKMRIERQMDFIFQNFENKDKSKKAILHMMMLDIINAERELQSQIDEMLAKGAYAGSDDHREAS